MDKKKENTPKTKPKSKLSREELLAGKIMSAEDEKRLNIMDDPLFRSPDDFLAKAKKPNQPKAKIKESKEGKSFLEKIIKPGPDHPKKSISSNPDILKEGSQFLDSEVITQYSQPRNGKDMPIKETDSKKRPKNDPLLKTMYEMKYRHEKEITRWKLYEQQVNNWKDRVLMIVTQLKKELLKSKNDQSEIQALKDLIAQKDEQIKKLKSSSKKKHK